MFALMLSCQLLRAIPHCPEQAQGLLTSSAAAHFFEERWVHGNHKLCLGRLRELRVVFSWFNL
jgi:hypothetical protein